MRQFQLSRLIHAPIDRVWNVMDDFGNIAEWNAGVSASRMLTEGEVSHGTERRCDLAPMGAVHERITRHEVGERMTIHIYKAFKLPLKEAVADFTFASKGDDTEATVDYSYTPNVFGRIMGPWLDKQLRKGIGGLLKGLQEESERVPSA